MKYTTTIVIHLSRKKVLTLFDSIENMYKWQPELLSFEHLSGDPGQEGAQSKLIYKMGKGEVKMTETITKRSFPHEFSGIYEAKGVWNQQQNFFEEVDSQTTKWVSISEFRCTGFMKIICLLMPGSFKKQTLQFMMRFKEFAENATPY